MGGCEYEKRLVQAARVLSEWRRGRDIARAESKSENSVRLQVLLLFKQHKEHNKKDLHVECRKVHLRICVGYLVLEPSGRLDAFGA